MQTNSQININEYNSLLFMINSLSSDLNNLKIFIKFLKDLISKSTMTSTYEIYLSKLNNINLILPMIIKGLSIPLSDLILEDNEIINYYINIFVSTKSCIIKNILISLFNTFNFKSISISPCEALIQTLQNNDTDIKYLSEHKRENKTEIENIYDNLSDINAKISSSKVQCKESEQYQIILNEIINKINELKSKNIYSNTIIEYFTEKAKEIEDSLNNKEITNNNNKINNINNYELNNKNNINLFNNFNFFNTFYNSIKNNNNNGLSLKEIQELKEIPLKDRTFLYRDEELDEGEDEYIEYKEYRYPFSQDQIDEIKRQYCGFLNNNGGRIYIGINDLKIVKGIELDYKKRDTLRNELVNYTYDFYPKCRLNKINVYFIPIRSMQNKKNITNLYVINIIILPGEPYYLYSLSNKRGYISAVRQPGQCINLTAEEIHAEIMRRALLKDKNIYTNENKKEETEAIDNINKGNKSEEDTVEDEDIEDDKDDEDEKNKMKIIYVVKITNIDKSLKVKEINKYFNECKKSYSHFPAKDGKSEGYGEVHFSKKETAKDFIQKYNRINLCGQKQLNMLLKKRKVPK